MLSVGELNKNKNHSIVLRSIAHLNDKSIHYVICGEGPLKGELKDLAFQLGIDNQVHLLGYRNDIADICYSSDIFIFPSLREGLGMAALEAMASGLPIIGSNVHGIVDYTLDGITGFTCNPKDEYEISKAIVKLKNDSNLRSKISEFNLEYIKKYDEINVLKKKRKIYLGSQA